MNGQSPDGFSVGVDFQSILRIISKQIYETPFAFVRENVQNAVDAIRIQAGRERANASDSKYRVEVSVDDATITVRDNGNGMSADDMRDFFWAIGASGKRTVEAVAAGCIGTFGIGGFANFGVCNQVEVISQTEGAMEGTLTRLSEADIGAAGRALPVVTKLTSNEAAPRGTIVIGYLRERPNADELRRYLQDFVKYVPTQIYFNSRRIPHSAFGNIEDRDNLTEVSGGTAEWAEGDMTIFGRLFEDRGHALVAEIESLQIGSKKLSLTGQIRFESGAIDVFKRGFKLCATRVGTRIGVSGRVDCDSFVPTAGRDSLDAETASLLGRIVAVLEAVAVRAVLDSSARIAEHTRVFRYVLQHGMIEDLGKVVVRLADGSEDTLGSIRDRRLKGRVGVFFGRTQRESLSHIMQARGHVVVLLSHDRYRRDAEQRYLERYCEAKAFDGMIECAERYGELDTFEKVFLSEVELNISGSYEIDQFELVAGRMTEDIPVFVREGIGGGSVEVFVDVRHAEVVKLERLGFTRVFYSIVAAFCREYLGPSLKKWSPKFFGDGAINIDVAVKRYSESWVLLNDDIRVVRRGEIVRSADVHTITIDDEGDGEVGAGVEDESARPRLVEIIGDRAAGVFAGFYIRLPESGFLAYGDLILGCDNLGVVWAGNRIVYVASDAVSSAFQYEIRLEVLAIVEMDDGVHVEGAVEVEAPVQSMFEGLYFLVPCVLEEFLIPRGSQQIKINLYCEWSDLRTARRWVAKEDVEGSGS